MEWRIEKNHMKIIVRLWSWRREETIVEADEIRDGGWSVRRRWPMAATESLSSLVSLSVSLSLPLSLSLSLETWVTSKFWIGFLYFRFGRLGKWAKALEMGQFNESLNRSKTFFFFFFLFIFLGWEGPECSWALPPFNWYILWR